MNNHNIGNINIMSERQDDEYRDVTKQTLQEMPPTEAGFIKYYGLYWKKDAVDWKSKQLLGKPKGAMRRGRPPRGFDLSSVQTNFWGQAGVYILYDSNLNPVYAGQAGRSTAGSGRNIGNRLNAHRLGVYRNGWSLFSWFGFMHTDSLDPKDPEIETKRLKPNWKFEQVTKDSELKQLLASFEAIVIEGFAPRFNARGGDLRKAIFVDQYDRE